MPEIKLSDGREVKVNLLKISMKEYRDWFFNPQVEDEVADGYIEKVTGIKEASELPQPDYRLLVNRIFELSRQPLSDPNS
jgi:hypothetical protein